MSFEPTPDQEKLITFQPSGNLLIRGEAGSGKTTVLAMRSGWMRSQESRGSMLFLTYNSALEAYVERHFADEGVRDVEVKTFHSWAGEFTKKLGGESLPFLKDCARKELVERALVGQQSKWGKHRLLSQPVAFWIEEFEWLFGQFVRNLQQYEERPRLGRGTAVRVGRGEDRQCVWDVFESYKKLVRNEECLDSADVCSMVLDAVQKAGGKFPERLQYDHVFVDEVQDFDASWLMAVSPLARVSLTLAGDLAQRIYRRTFTWKSVGIDLPPSRSKKLVGSHRTTRQVMLVAQHLAENPDVKQDEDYVEPTLPDRKGPKVFRILRSKWWKAEEDAARHCEWLRGRYPDATFVLAAQFNKKVDTLAEYLSNQGSSYEVAKGRAISPCPGQILVTTFHQLKGLEFDHVILTGLGDSTMPGFYLDQETSETPEEKQNYLRRLLYVAMTRARTSVSLAGGVPFSRFFDDVPPNFFEER